MAISFPTQLHLGALGRLESRARDLAAGGVCVSTPSCFAPQSLRRVTLLLPSGPTEIPAVGCWQLEVTGEDAFLTGIRFVDVFEKALERVWDVVHAQSKALTRWLLQQRDFAALHLCDAMDLVHVTRMRDLRAGQVLYRQGVREDSVFVVLRGEIALERRTPRQRTLVVGRAAPGHVLGGLGVVANSVPSESGLAEHDTTLLEISRGAFESLQRTNPPVAFQLGSLVMQNHLRRVDSVLGRLADELR